MNLEQKLLNYLQQLSSPISPQQLSRDLHLSTIEKRHVQDTLLQMEQEYLVAQSNNQWGLLPIFKLALCRADISSQGFIFGIPEIANSTNKFNLKDIKITNGHKYALMNGDQILVEYNPPDSQGRYNGRIIKLIKHAATKFVGTLELSKSFGIVRADDYRLKLKALVPLTAKKQLRTGMKVVVSIDKYPTIRKPAEGHIIEILGYFNDPGVDILSIMRKYDIIPEFPEEVLSQAATIKPKLQPANYRNRLDLRHIPMVTIDGEDAKDLDDAVYATPLDNDNMQLDVYIADVAHYVKHKSALDNEAYKRGTSIYLADRVVPMLPQALSNGICSLNAGEDRLSVCIQMIINPAGTVIDYTIKEVVIRVYRRLTYKLVNAIIRKSDSLIVEDNQDIKELIDNLQEVFRRLNKRRLNRGSIDFNLPEVKVILDETGTAIDLAKRERGIAERIIEECMLVANETIAEHLYKLEYPFIYRNHEQPVSDKLDNLRGFLANFNLTVPDNEKLQSLHLQKILHKISGKPEEKIISTITLRSMQQAKYGAENLGHFGLAAKYYTHFTSPIRRYPDLIVHRLLKAYLHDKTKVFKQYERLLPEIAQHTSKRERIAVDAERETIFIKEVEYMQQFIGQKFHGIISNVTAFGLFVELDNGVEGLVHLNSMRNDDYAFDPQHYSLTGLYSHVRYQIGQEATVILQGANKELQRIDFILVDNHADLGLLNTFINQYQDIIATNINESSKSINPDFSDKYTSYKHRKKAVATKFCPKSTKDKPTPKSSSKKKLSKKNKHSSKTRAEKKLSKLKSSKKSSRYAIYQELDDIDSFVNELGSRRHKNKL